MSLLRSTFVDDPWVIMEFSDLEHAFRQAQREVNRSLNHFFNSTTHSSSSSSNTTNITNTTNTTNTSPNHHHHHHQSMNSHSSNLASSSMFVPRIDLHESEKAFTILADLPGIPKENVKLEAHEDKLILSGEMENQWTKTDSTDSSSSSNCSDSSYPKLYIKERRWGKFHRVLPLPPNVDKEKVSASMENGVLSLTLPKLELSSTNARFININ